MNNQKPNFDEFCQLCPELLVQARKYVQGIIDNQEGA